MTRRFLEHLLLVPCFLSLALIFMGAKIPVLEVELKEIQVQIDGDTWIAWCLNDTAGKRRVKKDLGLVFISYHDLVTKFRKKQKIAKQAGNTILKKKYGKKKRIFKKLDNTSSVVCQSLKNDEDPEQEQEQGGENEDDENDSQDSSQDSYFYSSGDVTPLGKTVFEIPTSITANAFVGEIVFQYNCLGCHSKRSRPTMPLLRQAISPSPMSFTEDVFPDQDLADLTAYLQIGRSPLLE